MHTWRTKEISIENIALEYDDVPAWVGERGVAFRFNIVHQKHKNDTFLKL